jgi:hypothetical protein
MKWTDSSTTTAISDRVRVGSPADGREPTRKEGSGTLVNLISGKRGSEFFPALDEGLRRTLLERARRISFRRADAFVRGPIVEPLRQLEHALAEELEELDAAPTRSGAQAIIDRIDELRMAEAPGEASFEADGEEATDSGFWLCYRPGRSLGGGEAQVASLGFFDVWDRPPLVLWLEAIARPRGGRRGIFDVAVLCWIPSVFNQRARDGRAACPTGGLLHFEEAVEGRPPEMRQGFR